MPSLHSLPPEEAYRLACEMQKVGVYGPWLLHVDRWYRDPPFRGGLGSRCVYPDDGEFWTEVNGDMVGFPSARAAMQAADEQLRASGAILVGGVPEE